MFVDAKNFKNTFVSEFSDILENITENLVVLLVFHNFASHTNCDIKGYVIYNHFLNIWI